MHDKMQTKCIYIKLYKKQATNFNKVSLVFIYIFIYTCVKLHDKMQTKCIKLYKEQTTNFNKVSLVLYIHICVQKYTTKCKPSV